MKRRVLGAALTCLSLVLVLFLGSAQTTDIYSSVRGFLSGTTVAPGTYSFTIHAKDSGGDNTYFCDGNYSVVVDGVNQAPSFTSRGDVTMV